MSKLVCKAYHCGIPIGCSQVTVISVSECHRESIMMLNRPLGKHHVFVSSLQLSYKPCFPFCFSTSLLIPEAVVVGGTPLQADLHCVSASTQEGMNNNNKKLKERSLLVPPTPLYFLLQCAENVFILDSPVSIYHRPRIDNINFHYSILTAERLFIW